MNKKGFELSVNFIVMLILAIAMLALSFSFLGNFFKGAVNYKDSLGSQIDSQIESLLNGGDRVVIPFDFKQVHRKEAAIFRIGIMSVLACDSGNAEFKVEITQSYPEGSTELEDDVQYVKDPFTLKNNEQKKMPILITVPSETATGDYVFNVVVKYKDCAGTGDFIPYAPLQKIRIKVY